jgi:hypothetical protein
MVKGKALSEEKRSRVQLGLPPSALFDLLRRLPYSLTSLRRTLIWSLSSSVASSNWLLSRMT